MKDLLLNDVELALIGFSLHKLITDIEYLNKEKNDDDLKEIENQAFKLIEKINNERDI